ncbi:MAG: acyltransferase family protein [Acidimicrobiales bacterium]
MPQIQERLDSLTGLRFLAALVVFCVHLEVVFYFRSPIPAAGRFFVQGPSGVSFFFILSGFVLTWSHRHGDQPRAFIRRRLARIGPLSVATWVITLVLLLAVGTPVPFGHAIAELLLVNVWAPSLSSHLTVNIPAWSLGCELFFYMTFPWLYQWLRTATVTNRRTIVAGALSILAILAWLCAPASTGTAKYWLLYFFPPTRLLEFIIGIVLALEVRERRIPHIGLMPAAVVAVGAYIADGWAPRSWAQVAVTVVPYSILIVAGAQSDIGAKRSILRSRAAVRLGAWSFAFYLVHWPVLVVMGHVVTGELNVTTSVVTALVSLALSVAAAGVLHEFLERPLEVRLRGAPLRVE